MIWSLISSRVNATVEIVGIIISKDNQTHNKAHRSRPAAEGKPGQIYFSGLSDGLALICITTNPLRTSVDIGWQRTEWNLCFRSKEMLMPRQAKVIVPGFPRLYLDRAQVSA